MRLGVLAVLLVASASPALPQAGPAPITRDEAMTLPPAELAERVLRQLGAQVQTMTRPNFAAASDMRMVSALQDLTFATAPRATDIVGLCAADRIDVNFERNPADPNESETPVRVRRIRAAQVYKVVGDIEPYAEVSEERQAEEERRCAGAGPVVRADYDDGGRAHFFRFEGADGPATALLVLQRAIGEARAERYRQIRCVAGVADCTAQLGSLDLGRLSHLEIGPIGVGGDRSLRRVAATFLIDGDAHSEVYRTVEIEAEIDEWGGASDPIRRLGRAEMSSTQVYNN